MKRDDDCINLLNVYMLICVTEFYLYKFLYFISKIGSSLATLHLFRGERTDLQDQVATTKSFLRAGMHVIHYQSTAHWVRNSHLLNENDIMTYFQVSVNSAAWFTCCI